MNIAKYCKELGMDLQGFKAYEKAVKEEAQEIFNKATKIRPQDTGMFFPTSELIEVATERDYFILNELKKLGMEFIENGEFYRI